MNNKYIKKFRDIFTVSTLAKFLTIAIIVITTLLPNLFDPENADWKKILTSFILSIVIVLASFVAQMSSTRKKEMEKDDYINSKNNHIDKIREIQKKQLSHYHRLYVRDENEKNYIEKVKDVFQQFEIDFQYYELGYAELKIALREKMIDKEQYSIIKLCKSARISFDKYDVRDLTSTQVLKKGRNSNESQQAVIVASNLLSKVSYMVAIGVIWGMFVYDETTGGKGVTPQAWLDLVSRLITFGGGLWCGKTTGEEIVADDIRLFDRFFNFNSKFVQEVESGIWKPTDDIKNINVLEHIRQIQNKEKEEAEHREAASVLVNEDDDEEIVELTEEEYLKLKSEENSRF